jgi:hypothetical protein
MAASAGVVESVDTADLKSADPCGRTGSSPVAGKKKCNIPITIRTNSPDNHLKVYCCPEKAAGLEG